MQNLIPIALSGGTASYDYVLCPALGVGLTSGGEYMDVELKAPVPLPRAVGTAGKAMVEGVEVGNFREIRMRRRQAA